MSGYVGVVVSDPALQSQFTQVELRSLNNKVFIYIPFSFFFILSNRNNDFANLLANQESKIRIMIDCGHFLVQFEQWRIS